MTLPAWYMAVAVAAAEADPVQSGRKALDHWLQYPWYDQAADGLKRIDVEPPPAPSSPWRFSPPDLSWLFWSVVAVILGLAVFLLWRWWRQWQMRPKAGPVSAVALAPRPEPQIESLPFPCRGRRAICWKKPVPPMPPATTAGPCCTSSATSSCSWGGGRSSTSSGGRPIANIFARRAAAERWAVCWNP